MGPGRYRMSVALAAHGGTADPGAGVDAGLRKNGIRMNR